jgi:autotransporter adhesin
MQVHQSTHKTSRTRFVLASASAVALWLAQGAMTEVQAASCGLALDDNDANINTVGGADSNGINSRLACGKDATASGGFGTAVGSSAQATGNDATALGSIAQATDLNSTAVGFISDATAGGSTAIGAGTDATGIQSTAVGEAAQATNTGSTALGRSANASAQGSVALGAFSVADQINTVSVGDASQGLTRRITNVAMGAENNDVVTVKQLKKSLKKSFKKGKAKVVTGTIQTTAQTSDQDQASTTVAKTAASSTKTKSSGGGSTSSGGSGPATVSQASFDQFASKTETQIDRLAQRDNKLAEGIAVVAALAQPVLLPGQHFAMRAGWGGYDSANAVAFSAAGVIADNLLRSGHGTLSLDGGVGWGTDEGEVVGRAGATFGW